MKFLSVDSSFLKGKVVENIDGAQVLGLKELGYGQGCHAIDSIHRIEMAIRTNDLRLVNKKSVRLISAVVELRHG